MSGAARDPADADFDYIPRARAMIEAARRDSPESEIAWVLAAALGLALPGIAPVERCVVMMHYLNAVAGAAAAFEYRRIDEAAAQLDGMVPAGCA
jgi:hypothetical protein